MKNISKVLQILMSIIILISFYGCATASPAPAPKPTENITLQTPAASPIEKQPPVIEQQATPAPEKPVEAAKVETPKTPLKLQGLVNILDIDNTIIVDLRYSTTNNFTGKVIYNFKTCLLREETAIKLNKANKILAKSGYRIKIYDGYRPPSAQKVLWSTVPDARYVANPSKGGSIHSKGAAVDITLVDSSGKELEMPTEYDNFTAKASPTSKAMTETARKNLLLLSEVMTSNGFKTITSEWWHYNDTDSSKYSPVEVDPRKFEGSQN